MKKMKNQQTVYSFPCEKLIQKDEDIREKHKKRWRRRRRRTDGGLAYLSRLMLDGMPDTFMISVPLGNSVDTMDINTLNRTAFLSAGTCDTEKPSEIEERRLGSEKGNLHMRRCRAFEHCARPS